MSFQIIKLTTCSDGSFEELESDRKWMPVPRCDTCKYWVKDEAEEDEGSCSLMYENGITKIWPDYRDGINTKADFGCVQWEGK